MKNEKDDMLMRLLAKLPGAIQGHPVRRGDTLRFRVRTFRPDTASSGTWEFQYGYTLLRLDALDRIEVVTISDTWNTITNNTVQTGGSQKTVPLTDGLLIFARVTPSNNNFVWGQVGAQIAVMQNGGTQQFTLADGPCKTDNELTWPGSYQSDSTPYGFAIANPAAGAEITFSLFGANAFAWNLHNFRFTLTADANVANRAVDLILDGGTILGTTWARYPSGNRAQTAGQAITYNFISGLPARDATVDTNEVLPNPCIIPAITPSSGATGGRIRTSTTNIQAGDQFSAISCVLTQTGA